MKRMQRIWFAVFGLLLVLVSLVIFRKESTKDWKQYQRKYFTAQGISDSARIHIISVTPSLTGEPELCLTCHIGIEQISDSHPVETFGCVTCHGGDGMTLDKTQAHSTLIGGRNPSDLSAVKQSCSGSPTGVACHNSYQEDKDWQNIIDRVERSLQATEAGAIQTVQYTFGITKSKTSQFGTAYVMDDSVHHKNYPKILKSIFQKIRQDSIHNQVHPMEAKFVKNCLEGGCHLNSPGIQKEYFHRSSGCAACHVLSDNDGLYKGNDVTIDKNEPGHSRVHRLTVEIPYTQCNHCHNRGIYSMKQMEFIERDDLKATQFVSAQDKRQQDYYIPLAEYTQCEVTLDCIDCHTHNEIMGNGDIFPDKTAAVEIQCATCHGTIDSPPDYAVIKSLNQQDAYIAEMNPNLSPQVGDTVAVTQRGTQLPWVKKVNGHWQQTSKINGTIYPVPLAYGSECRQDIDRQDSNSCHQCHDASNTGKHYE